MKTRTSSVTTLVGSYDASFFFFLCIFLSSNNTLLFLGDTESDEEADTSDSEMVATCLYREEQDSDEDEDTKVFQTWRKSFAPESTEVITIDDDDDEHFRKFLISCQMCGESENLQCL